MNTISPSLHSAALAPASAAAPLAPAGDAWAGASALLGAEVEPLAQGLSVAGHAQRVLAELLDGAGEQRA